MKIIDKLVEAQAEGTVPVSFEFFPPKMDEGLEQLYARIERMAAMQPLFVDITWGANKSTANQTLAICETVQKYMGVQVMMHLTCSGVTVDEMKMFLQRARDIGVRNILALRGEPPKGSDVFVPTPGGYDHAIDLVRLIRSEHGDHFCIGVAGHPEGHPSVPRQGDAGASTGATTPTKEGAASVLPPPPPPLTEEQQSHEVGYLKAKVEAGADFVITQCFFDTSVYASFVARCRAAGITVPIIPGLLPIQSYSMLQHIAKRNAMTVPEAVLEALQPIRSDDSAVKEYGVQLCVDMCRQLQAMNAPALHLFTLNLERSVLQVCRQLGVAERVAGMRPLPWKPCASSDALASLASAGDHAPQSAYALGPMASLSGSSRMQKEDVRPINWANRPVSYLRRTASWDEFPNGRWGDGRSPAFGDLSDLVHFGGSGHSKAERMAMWGDATALQSEQHVWARFVRFVRGELTSLPWCESSLHVETNDLETVLTACNNAGFLSINSQPSVNGVPSEHATYGWGGRGGRVFQKAYVEFFCSPKHLRILLDLIGGSGYGQLHLYATDAKGNSYCTAPAAQRGVSALTWGVFPNREVQQPTVFDPAVFSVWSQEAFALWSSAWQSIYDEGTASARTLQDVVDNYFLVAIIDHAFVQGTKPRVSAAGASTASTPASAGASSSQSAGAAARGVAGSGSTGASGCAGGSGEYVSGSLWALMDEAAVAVQAAGIALASTAAVVEAVVAPSASS